MMKSEEGVVVTESKKKEPVRGNREGGLSCEVQKVNLIFPTRSKPYHGKKESPVGPSLRVYEEEIKRDRGLSNREYFYKSIMLAGSKGGKLM